MLILSLLFALYAQGDSLQKAYVAGEPRNFDLSKIPEFRLCIGKERICKSGRKAGVVAKSCELVCPEDNRRDLECFHGMANQGDEMEETEIIYTTHPVIYSAGEKNTGPADDAPVDCEIFQKKEMPSLWGEYYAPSPNRAPARRGKVKSAE